LSDVSRCSKDAASRHTQFQDTQKLQQIGTRNTADMVLYHANGRVVKAHDDLLDKAEGKKAASGGYTHQFDVVAKKRPEAREAKNIRVHIRVDDQRQWREAYYPHWNDKDEFPNWFLGEKLDGFTLATKSKPLPAEGIDRRTLMKCSSFADEWFTFESGSTELGLPVCYPDSIEGVKTYMQPMAYIRENEIIAYIIPWLKAMERILQKPHIPKVDKLPKITIPARLDEKIHLYNVMLQLGIATRFTRPLVDSLILDMYQNNLRQCHLDTLEMTVCRFNSRAVAILDPVINHLVGTYSLRSRQDRDNPIPPAAIRAMPDHTALDDRGRENKYLPDGITRQWLSYSRARPDQRARFPDDTVSLPPKLEVLGHCIRHWSGVRRDGTTAAAHMGLPLNVGRVFKWYRRSPKDVIQLYRNKQEAQRWRNERYVSYSTHRLQKVQYYRDHPPGGPSDPDDDEDEEQA
jgi:hypothetical protein